MKLKFIYIQSKDVKDIEFEAFTLNQTNGLSYIDYFLNETLSQEEELNILSYLKRAHNLFLNGEKQEALNAFEQITLFSLKHDWSLGARKIIHQSFLRMAQLSNTESDKKNWLLKAIYFDDELLPDEKAFDPDFITLFNSLLKSEQKNVFLWDISSLKDSIESIRINGRRFRLQNGLKIKLFGSAPFRITFLSNKYLPTTLTINTEELKNLNLSLESLSSGHCEQPNFNKKIELKHKYYLTSYYSRTCIVTHSDSYNLKMNSQDFINENLKPDSVFKNKKQEFLDKRIDSELLSKQISESKNNSFNWVLGSAVGAVIVGTIVYYISKNKTETERRPTHE